MQSGKDRRLLAARQTGRIILAPEELVAHYFIVFLLLLFLLFYLYSQTHGTGKPDGKPYFEAAVFTLAVGLLFRQHRTLALMQYRVAHTPEQFREAARATAIELDWHILDLTDDHLIAEKHGLGWQWDGLRITALRSGDAIFINSMVKPSFRSNPFSFGWNSRNRNTFYQNLLLAAQGENVAANARKRVKEAVRIAENESEWTLRNTLKRLVAYVSIFILLSAGVLILSEGLFTKSLIPLFALTLGYLAADWYMILKKRKKTRR